MPVPLKDSSGAEKSVLLASQKQTFSRCRSMLTVDFRPMPAERDITGRRMTRKNPT